MKLESSPVFCAGDFTSLQERAQIFFKNMGRRPRILFANFCGKTDVQIIKIFASAFAEAGFDVDLSPIPATCKVVARMAVENDVHAIGIPCFGHEDQIHQLVKALEELEADDIKVITKEFSFGEELNTGSTNPAVSILSSTDHVLNLIGA